VAEADADERPARLRDPADEAGEAADPFACVVGAVLRAAAQPRVAVGRRLRQAALERAVVGELQVFQVGRKQVGEHLAVAARDAGEATDDVVALQQADAHQAFRRRWNDFGRVKLSSPILESVQPRPESFTPVQASAGSR
jgi:hypothetical protein